MGNVLPFCTVTQGGENPFYDKQPVWSGIPDFRLCCMRASPRGDTLKGRDNALPFLHLFCE